MPGSRERSALHDSDAVLTVNQAAERLGTHRSTILLWIRIGYLKAIQPTQRGHYQIPLKDVERVRRFRQRIPPKK
jgi:excisionase family DNA binding protein